MPLASPIGSGRGLKLRHAIEIMIEQAEVPVVVDAGLGAPSQAAECDGDGRRRRARQHGDRAGRRSRRDGAVPSGSRSRPAAPARLAGLIEERETRRGRRARSAASPRARDGHASTAARRRPAPGETVESLLERLGLAARYALVERNGEPVERERYGDTALEDGDALVVARPVAGG